MCIARRVQARQYASMSLLRLTLVAVFVAVSAAPLGSCSLPSESGDTAPSSDSRVAIHAAADGSVTELTGRDLSISADDSLIVRASVEGAPGLYESPVLSSNDTSAVTMRPDGTAALRRIGPTFTFRATARALSSRTRPALLADSGKLVPICAAFARAGLNIAIRDSVTGAAVSGSGLMRLFATNGTAVDSLRLPGVLANWSTAWERPGTWTVTIDTDGYARWQQGGLIVTQGLCHVAAVAVTARLQRK